MNQPLRGFAEISKAHLHGWKRECRLDPVFVTLLPSPSLTKSHPVLFAHPFVGSQSKTFERWGREGRRPAVDGNLVKDC